MERKHRIVVEVTLNKVCSEKQAMEALKDQLNGKLHQDFDWLPQVTHTKCKQFSRVVNKLEFIKS
jgi:hypothetical protein